MSDSPACRRLAHRTGVWWCQTRVMGATTVIALLRGINVGGHNKLPMAQLREIAASIGLADVQTYIQSGNLVGSTDGDPVAVGPALAEAITSATGLTVPVIVRTGGEWAEVVAANPFPDAVEPGKLVHVICLPTRGERVAAGIRRFRVRPGGVRRRRLGDLPPPPRGPGSLQARDGRQPPPRGCRRHCPQLEHRPEARRPRRPLTVPSP